MLRKKKKYTEEAKENVDLAGRLHPSQTQAFHTFPPIFYDQSVQFDIHKLPTGFEESHQ